MKAFLAALLLSSSALASPELDKAELLLLSGDFDQARPLIIEAQRAHVRDGTIREAESIRANRLHVEYLAATDPPRALDTARRLIHHATESLGPSHRETLLARTALAEALNANDQAEQALEIWREVGTAFRNADPAGAPSRDVAHCLAGMAFTIIEGVEADCRFEGDPTQPIEPQIKAATVYPSETLRAIELLRQALHIHVDVGGEQDPRAVALRGALLKLKEDMDESVFQLRAKAAKEIREKLLASMKLERLQAIEEWKAANPDPTVYICAGESAVAYHIASCHHLEDCDSASVPAARAVNVHHRRACKVCEPPPPSQVPTEFFELLFDGKSIRLQ